MAANRDVEPIWNKCQTTQLEATFWIVQVTFYDVFKITAPFNKVVVIKGHFKDLY